MNVQAFIFHPVVLFLFFLENQNNSSTILDLLFGLKNFQESDLWELEMAVHDN